MVKIASNLDSLYLLCWDW